MELRIRIGERAAFFLLIGVALASAIGITMAAPPDPGHAWGEIECVGCISSSNLADSSVTSGKLASGSVTSAKLASGAVTGAKIADGAVTDAKVDGIDWSKIKTGMPSDIADGDDKGTLECIIVTQGYSCSQNYCASPYVKTGCFSTVDMEGLSHPNNICCRIV